MKSVIVRIAPVSNVPVVFYPESRAGGQIKGVLNGVEQTFGIDYYQATSSIEKSQAKQIALAFAKKHNIPEEELAVRHRLPKSAPAARRLDDANLIVAPKADKGKTLQQAAQELQEQHDKKQQEKKASPANPEGAVVKASDGKKRSYVKRNNKKSEAAMKRYLTELGQVSAQSPTLMEAAKTDAPQEVVDKATMDLALALARILKAHPGVI